MINEYQKEIDYWGRNKDWFSDSLELTQDTSGELSKSERACKDVFASSSVYQKNGIFLETVDGSERVSRGVFTSGMGFPLAVVCSFLVYMEIKVVRSIFDYGIDFMSLLLALAILAGALGLSWFFTQMHLKKDVFTYRHAAIRFNRKTRQVHVFYSPSLGGARSYEWDDVIPKIELEKDGFYILNMIAAAPDRKHYYDSFTVGEGYGREDCLAWWEYIRRFMEEGPDSVPEPDWYLSDRLSLKESFLRWFPLREMRRDKARGMNIGRVKMITILGAPVLTLLSLGHFVSMLTSRRVTWPQEIRKACGEE